jgi:hypothetical protein
VFPCIAHHMIILGWVRWWASPATWRLSCVQYTMLCRFTYYSRNTLNHWTRYRSLGFLVI